MRNPPVGAEIQKIKRVILYEKLTYEATKDGEKVGGEDRVRTKGKEKREGMLGQLIENIQDILQPCRRDKPISFRFQKSCLLSLSLPSEPLRRFSPT